jgi:hypothetical protein
MTVYQSLFGRAKIKIRARADTTYTFQIADSFDENGDPVNPLDIQNWSGGWADLHTNPAGSLSTDPPIASATVAIVDGPNGKYSVRVDRTVSDTLQTALAITGLMDVFFDDASGDRQKVGEIIWTLNPATTLTF